ncbi:MAG: acyl-CoA dehydrogenase [Deltaproteobacteria bacterium]|nr:acyl-CoA dehydrogenase [Deltaproteobacteria bacterium]
MAEKFMSMRNLKFLLYEVFDAASLTRHSYYEEYDRKMLDMVLEAAEELARGLLWPYFQEMDRNPPKLADDGVKVHPSVRKGLKEMGEGGWIAMTVPEELDGQQLPQMIADSCRFIFCAANYSGAAYSGLCVGAARLIVNFGSRELYDAFVPNIRSGRWQGTMALTESEAGSSLSDITTTAELGENGHYRIYGQKVFISAGDHDGVENVVHLMLARIKGAPQGVKGISLFAVPKKRISEHGDLVSNDVTVSGIFHKLGYRGCPTTQLNMGDHNDCRGYLVGEAHKGLGYMFQMMNEARIGVGMGACAMATAAYYASIDYAVTRKQGRKIEDKNPANPPVPIIEHADVKRMLLFQRAVAEGSLSLLLQCSLYVDLKIVGSDEDQNKYALLLDLLTPVAKSYPSETGIVSISHALQCFGGSGYCDDYPLEQSYRDARIHPIHEGTTGIHGLDLLGRKIPMKNGKAFHLFCEELETAIVKAKETPDLESYGGQLSNSLEKLKEVTVHLAGIQKAKGIEHALADATLYLELFGIIAIAWQWLMQATVIVKALNGKPPETEVEFYQGKFYAFRYFFGYELPKAEGLLNRLMQTDGLTVSMKKEWFSD